MKKRRTESTLWKLCHSNT